MLSSFVSIISVLKDYYLGKYVRIFSSGYGVIAQGYVVDVSTDCIYGTGEDCIKFLLRDKKTQNPLPILVKLAISIEIVEDKNKIKEYIKVLPVLKSIAKKKIRKTFKIQYCTFDRHLKKLEALVSYKHTNNYFWESIDLTKEELKKCEDLYR